MVLTPFPQVYDSDAIWQNVLSLSLPSLECNNIAPVAADSARAGHVIRNFRLALEGCGRFVAGRQDHDETQAVGAALVRDQACFSQ
jgi:hypothetical protein